MASGTLSTRPQAEGGPVVGRYEDFIQKRLEHTRRQVRLVDVGSNLILLLGASLLFFLAVAIADHWVFAHGLNFFGRLLLWAVWIGLAGTFAWRFIAPSAMHHINPVFAAHAIEQGRPTLKNSLINFLLLRSHPEQVAPVVYQAMEHRAASDLSKVPVEHAVDNRRLIHLTYFLAGAVALFVVYLVLSPKNPLISAARVIWPWAGIAAPTRVHIEDVRPGEAIVFRGDTQTISAHISGVRSGEEVALLVSTPDGRLIDDRVAMTRTGDDERYTVDLPTIQGGMQQDTLYRITAGDATTQQYKLEVHDSPTIVVDQIDYHFPAYTGYADQTIKGQGDIKAIEGTRVTIHASANMEIRDAQVELGCSALQARAMAHAGTKASAEITLALNPEKLSEAQFDRYQIRFYDLEGNIVRHPIQYRIDVDRDYPPEIEVTDPKSEETAVAVDGRLFIRVRASDDFALQRVTLYVERGDQRLVTRDMLLRQTREKAVKNMRDQYEFVPAELGLKAGDHVKYWVAADDNKTPKANHTETSPRTIKIVANEQEAQQERQQGQPQGDNSSGEGKPQQGSDNGQGDKGQGGQGHESKDGTQSGDNASPDNKEGGQSKDNSTSGQEGDKSQQDKTNAGNSRDNPSSDKKDDQQGDQNSPNANDHGHTSPKDETKKADVMRDLVKQTQQDQQDQQQKSNDKPKPDQGQDNKQDGNKQDGNSPSGGQPQNGGNQDNSQPGQQNKPQQSGSEKNQSQGGQGTQSQDGSQPNSGAQSPNSAGTQGSNQQGNSSNGASGQQQPNTKSGEQNSGNKDNAGQSPQNGNQNTSPQQSGENGQQPNAGSQPQGGQKPSSEQNSGQNGGGSQEKQNSNSTAGQEKNASNSGSANKQDPKQTGSKGDQQSQAAGGTPAQKEKQAGGEPKNGNQQSGSNPSKTEQKPGSQSGDPGQLAMNGKPNEKKDASQAGGASSPISPSGQPKEENKPKTGSNSAGGGGSGGEKKQQKDGGDQPSSDSGNTKSKGGTPSKQGEMGNGQPRQQDEGKPGTGDRMDSSGAPDRQTDPNRTGNKEGNANPNSDQSDKSQSPTNSPNDSKSNGESKGDRSGGGDKGGGQSSKDPGRGKPGSSTSAESGGSVSPEKGNDATGNKAGQEKTTSNNTGSPRKEQGNGSGEKPQSPDQNAADNNNAQPPQGNPNQANNEAGQQNTSGGEPGAPSPEGAGTQGSGVPSGGSRNGTQAANPPASEQAQQGTPDQTDPEFANKQVGMALNHLKDELKKQKPELLDKLGWSKEEAQKFYDNMSKLRDSAQQPGGDAANKKAYDEFLKNLDLRPHGTRISGNSTKKDNVHDVLDAGQTATPAEWDEATRDYARETAGK